MITIFRFLIDFCPQLLESPDFRITDSKTGRNGFEGSCILFESGDTEIFISVERGQLGLQMRSKFDPKKRNWFSFDLIGQMLGYDVTTGVMNPETSSILARDFDRVITCFKKSKIRKTLARLEELKRARLKRM